RPRRPLRRSSASSMLPWTRRTSATLMASSYPSRSYLTTMVPSSSARAAITSGRADVTKRLARRRRYASLGDAASVSYWTGCLAGLRVVFLAVSFLAAALLVVFLAAVLLVVFAVLLVARAAVVFLLLPARSFGGLDLLVPFFTFASFPGHRTLFRACQVGAGGR